MPYCVTIAFGDVLCPPVDELLDRVPHRLASVPALVLVPEPHKPVGNAKNAPLRDGRTPHIAPGVAQEMFFSVEGLHMYPPRALLLPLKQTFHFVASHP